MPNFQENLFASTEPIYADCSADPIAHEPLPLEVVPVEPEPELIVPKFEENLKPFITERSKLSTEYWETYLATGCGDKSLITKSIMLDQWILRECHKDLWGKYADLVWFCSWKFYALWKHTDDIADLKTAAEYLLVLSKLNRDPDAYLLDEEKSSKLQRKLLKLYRGIYDRSDQDNIWYLDKAILVGQSCLQMQGCPPEKREKVFWGLLFCVVDLNNAQSEKSEETTKTLIDILMEYTSWTTKEEPSAKCRSIGESYLARAIPNEDPQAESKKGKKQKAIPPKILMAVSEMLYQYYESVPNEQHDTEREKDPSLICLSFAIDFRQYALQLTTSAMPEYVTRTLKLVEALTQRHRRLHTAESETRDLDKASALLDRLPKSGVTLSPTDDAWVNHWRSVHYLLRYKPVVEGSITTLNDATIHATVAVRSGWDLFSKAAEKDAREISTSLLSWAYQLEDVLIRKLQYHLDRKDMEGCLEVKQKMKNILNQLSIANQTINAADSWIGKAQGLLTDAWLTYVEYCAEARAHPKDEPELEKWRNKRTDLLNVTISKGLQALFRAQDISRIASEANSHVEANIYMCLSTFYLARYLNAKHDQCVHVGSSSADDPKAQREIKLEESKCQEDLNDANRYSRLAIRRASEQGPCKTIQERHFYLRTLQTHVAILFQTFRTTGNYVHLRSAVDLQEEAVTDSSADRLLCARYTVALGHYRQLLLEDPEYHSVQDLKNSPKKIRFQSLLAKSIKGIMEAYTVLTDYGDTQLILSALGTLTSLCTDLYKAQPDDKLHQEFLEKAILWATHAIPEGDPASSSFDEVSLLTTLSEAHQAQSETDRDQLPKAISYAQQALKAANKYPEEKAFERAELNYHLGLMLFTLHKGSLSDHGIGEIVLKPLLDCLDQTSAPPVFRLRAAVAAAEVLEQLKDWSRLYLKMKLAVSLIPRLSLKSLPRQDQQQVLKSVSGLGSIAAAAALQCHGESVVAEALGFIEAGRDLITGNYFAARADIRAILDADHKLGEDYEAIVHEWESAEVQNQPPPTLQTADNSRHNHFFQGPLQRLKHLAHFSSNFTQRFDSVIARIRNLKLPTLWDPPEVEDMKKAAGDGTIVVVNVARWRCDALIVNKHGVKLCTLGLLNAAGIDRYVPNKSQDDKKRQGIPFSPYADETLWVWLWRTIAGPVLVDFLELIKCPSDKDGKGQLQEPSRRVWWIMTGSTCRLPIHAAASHNGAKAVPLLCVSDYVVSSYTTSFKALIFARGQRALRAGLKQPQGQLQALLCALTNTEHDEDWTLWPLENVEKEVESISEELSGFTSKTGTLVDVHVWPKPQAQAVVNALSPLAKEVPNTSIFHFAGHGVSSATDPSASGIYLNDARLTVTKLMQAKVYSTAPLLAYLSACSTGTTSLLPDEGVHIMSGFVAAGFMNVVGTLWNVPDNMSKLIAVQFFKYWVEKELKPEMVAWCLQMAVADKGIEQGESEDKYACFVHTGI